MSFSVCIKMIILSGFLPSLSKASSTFWNCPNLCLLQAINWHGHKQWGPWCICGRQQLFWYSPADAADECVSLLQSQSWRVVLNSSRVRCLGHYKACRPRCDGCCANVDRDDKWVRTQWGAYIRTAGALHRTGAALQTGSASVYWGSCELEGALFGIWAFLKSFEFAEKNWYEANLYLESGSAL